MAALSPYSYTEAELHAGLPFPVLEAHPQWIDLYWKAWKDAVRLVRRGTAKNGFADYYITVNHNNNVYQWDSCFSVFWERYGFQMFPGIASLDNFYLKQHADGYICRELKESTGADYWTYDHPNAINPPLYSWAEWAHYQATADKARLRRIFPKLIKYYDWVKAHRRWTDSKLYWSTGYACGLDNAPRGPDERVDQHWDQGWIDMSAQMALDAMYLKRIALELDDSAAAADNFQKDYDELKALINSKMWDERDGFYYDTKKSGDFVRIKTLTSYWTMLARLSSTAQNERLVARLRNPNEFARKHWFASLSADDKAYNPLGEYWKGSVWASLDYMVIKGLEVNGYDKLARAAAENHVESMSQVYRNTGSIWENYAPDLISQGSQSHELYNWSCLGPIALLIENIIGIELNAPARTLHWKINRLERHGIRNLRLGDNLLSLICEKRNRASDRPQLTVTANAPFKLVVETDSGLSERDFAFGQHQWKIK